MPIQKLLIANRGEIASRVMRTAHRLGISTVAVYSDPDAGLPFVAQADEAVRLPGAAPADTYLRGDLILAAAAITGADAIHPGYGFLSENAGFARDCAAAGVVFVGPPADAIAAMGSKLAAKALMESAGVPVLPGATVDDSTDLDQAGARVGFPLLVKAAFGGGGRGMRLVREPGGLAEAVAAASREAQAAFGDGTVFLERFVTDPRHVEVQILGDTHGTVVHLFERECSIQRRYQKIIEESPSPAVDDALRAALGEAAVAAGKVIGYAGAGTVEFVLDDAGRFYFLEVNTRLQVEHPVTELVTGLDLVQAQLGVAEGEPLPTEITDATLTGHAIEARLYAEDVPAGFLPCTGTLHRFTIPAGDGIRVDAGYADGSAVSPHYDAMLAKVIAHGRTRAQAARRLARALARARLHGVTTNRGLLLGVLREPEFLAGCTDTGYLTRHDPAGLSRAALGDPAVHAAVAALARQAAHRAEAPVLATLPSGWRNVASAPNRVSYRVDGRDYEVTYRLSGRAGEASDVEVDGQPLGSRVVVVRAAADAVDLEVDGLRRVYSVHRGAAGAGPAPVWVDGPDGATTLTELPRFADPSAVPRGGSLLAPMPGLVVRVLAEAGAAVTAGQPLVVLEAMKMEHTVTAPSDGVLAELRASAGEQVDAGQVLAVVETPDSAAPEET
ncbi:MAG TPA: biotin carboxylase N-terminal domain-containing protein [Streptosporangiaceae bacterium]|nr:biotin carboxylase N-terminal domain-containing protein [Streptosporangiaceae bacterium]